VAGHKDHPKLAYMGTAGGGVFKTTDGGKTWLSITDKSFKAASVGAIAVAPSDANVVYVGMGETDIRGNLSPGDGIWKSTDGGQTWKHMGLGKTEFIGDIVVHPDNPDIVWVAAMGHVFGTKGNKERGVYKSTDGGKTWEKVLYRDAHTGAVDLAIDPNNPRILFAGLWQAYRNAWKMSSGGTGSGLYKSTDGGETWREISDHAGLPKGLMGKIGIDVSAAQPGRVYAIIENKNGGLFRSDDYGKTWSRVNADRNLRQRAWYFTEVKADPKDPETVYVLNVRFHKSDDGGKTFKTIGTPHGDHHDLWVDPSEPRHLIIGDDGGAQVSYNGGASWSSMYQYSTAQIYHVLVDNQFPYNVYGAQQDQGTVKIKNRSKGYGITRSDWSPVAGFESGFIAYDPENPNITYGGSYSGDLQKYNSRTDQRWQINVWPDNPMGHPAKDLKYRFQWTYPIIVSPHNPDELFVTSQYVHRSTDGGMSWQTISPDLTRNDTTKQQSSGGPITKDNTSVEYYNTIFTFDESPVQQGVLWAGADDGLIHVSRDNGKTWKDVTPKGMPEGLANMISPSPFEVSKAYLSMTRYKFDDFSPYLYKTENYGKSWTRIDKGLPHNAITRVVREDPNREGLLYAGTETGVYVSFDDGKNWQPLQLDLPHAAVTDLVVQKRDKDLVISTKGRGFWILDDLPVLYQLNDQVTKSDEYLFKPQRTYLFGGGSGHQPGSTVGENPPAGVVVHYKLKDSTDKEIKLQFLEAGGDTIRTFSSKKDSHGHEVKESSEFHENPKQHRSDVLDNHKGTNRFVWDMRYPPVTRIHPQVLWGGNTQGPRAIPGSYKVRLIVGDDTVGTRNFEIVKDPRIETTQKNFLAQFDLISDIKAKLDTTQKSINKIREVRDQINKLIQDNPSHQSARVTAQPVLDKLSNIEQHLVQVKARAPQDPLNYPIKLNNKLAALASNVSRGDHRPTKQQYEVFDELSKKVDVQLEQLQNLLEKDVPDVMRKIYVKPEMLRVDTNH